MAGVNPDRRSTDAMAHAHLRTADPDDQPRLHHRIGDPAVPRFEWKPPPKEETTMHPGMEDVPRTECADACAFGAFIGALAGCFMAGLAVAGILMLWPGR